MKTDTFVLSADAKKHLAQYEAAERAYADVLDALRRSGKWPRDDMGRLALAERRIAEARYSFMQEMLRIVRGK